MTLRERIGNQIQDGQNEANKIIEEIKRAILYLDKQGVALATFKEEVVTEIKKIL